MKKMYLRIIIFFIILSLIFANCSYAASGLDVIQQHQQQQQNSNSSSGTVHSQTHPNADTNPLNDEQGNNSGQSTGSGSLGGSSSGTSNDGSGEGSSGTSNDGSGEGSSGTTGGKSGTFSSTTPQSIDEIISGADNFINNADTSNTVSQDSLQKTIDLVYNVLLAIGLVVAVVVGIILGIEFMVSSSDGQAKVKEKLIPYAVGCVIIFGAFGIWKLVMVLLGTF